MTLFLFYLSVRDDLLFQISGVKNSNGILTWDDTTPNYIIKNRLSALLDSYVLRLSALGMFMVTRYCSCTNSAHNNYIVSDGYGLDVSYRDARYTWSDHQLFQGNRNAICPCSPTNKLGECYVIDEFIYSDASFLERSKRIFEILEDVSIAVSRANDNRSRSGIRESLLRALLRVNDAILPQSVDDYVEGIKLKCSERS